MMIKMDFENLLYEGKAKSVYQGESENEVIVKFRDDMTAGDGARKESMGQKGYFNSIISSKIFETLEEAKNFFEGGKKGDPCTYCFPE